MRIGLAVLALAMGCGPRGEGANPGECSDAADNDGDGLFDCADSDCAESPDCVGGPDADGDGVHATQDCDDGDPAIQPSADDAVGDDIDQNCDGTDGVDADGDGVASNASGGQDCDDANPAVHAGAADASNDGIDQDCNGLDGPDADFDGYVDDAFGGDDCDDTNASIHPGAFDACLDGVDSDCDDVDPQSPVVVTWSATGATVDVDPCAGEGPFSFGIAETSVGSNPWQGEDCLGSDVCHTIEAPSDTLTTVRQQDQVADGFTLFDDARIDDALDTFVFITPEKCWSWGADPAYYSSLQCSAL